MKDAAFFHRFWQQENIGELAIGGKSARMPNQASLRCVNVTSNCAYSFFIGRFEPQYGQTADCFPVHFTSSERIGPPHCGQVTGNRSTRWMGSTGAGVIMVGTVELASGLPLEADSGSIVQTHPERVIRIRWRPRSTPKCRATNVRPGREKRTRLTKKCHGRAATDGTTMDHIEIFYACAYHYPLRIKFTVQT